MEENPMLAMLAKLCGDINTTLNSDSEQVLQLQQSIASTLLSDPEVSSSGLFQFEQLESFTTHHLSQGDLHQLNEVLQNVQKTTRSADDTIRIFRREVPFLSSQVKGSVPDWARGASVTKTIGPLVNRDGRRFWFDFYKIIPVVQVWLQGAVRPFMLLPLEVRKLAIFNTGNYTIPAGSVWINADIFDAGSPDSLYCGLTVSGGELRFDSPLPVTAGNKLVMPAGMKVTVHLDLEQKVVTENSPDDNGIDARETKIDLPGSLTFSVKKTGVVFTEIGAARWNLYGQEVHFEFAKTKPIRWSAELNRVIIPFQADVSAVTVIKCKSSVCRIRGKATIVESGWALPAAAININAPLKADGTGAMVTGVLKGLKVHWPGLKDANLFENTSALLNNALIMVMPGRINIATLDASNATGKQRYNLWQEPATAFDRPAQYIDLFYTKKFFFFYDTLRPGIENIAVQANCVNNVNKPVKVDGAPFKVESLQTILALSFSKAFQIVMLYDDNILIDNWQKNNTPVPGKPLPPFSFESTAIALNNALLKVTPVSGLFLYGDIKTPDSFDKCLLVYSFGLLQYLPTLPDPYAANISFLNLRGNAGTNSGGGMMKKEQEYAMNDIHAFLVCLMNWENMSPPEVSFFLGDKPSDIKKEIADVVESSAGKQSGVKLSKLHDRETIQQFQQSKSERTHQIQNRNWQAVNSYPTGTAPMPKSETATMMMATQSMARDSRFHNAFTLLDVSTNADLMGVSLGFSNDDYIFRKTHIVKEELPANPLTISGMDVHATSRLVQMFALPQISWEPVINTTTDITNPAQDPYPGVLIFLNDGFPAQIANTGSESVNLAPIPLSRKLTEWYAAKDNFALWSYFTLPYGMTALAMYFRETGSNNPKLELIEKKFAGDLHTGLQIKTLGRKDPINKNRMFYGSAHQLSNAYNLFFPGTGARSILSGSVTEIFNDEFGSLTGLDEDKYVPLERYDFSGYGANVFSHWVNENAALAQTSQAMFDVWRGRTAHEVIQVKSVLYPWGIRVVRTITIYRGSNGFEWRIDSGWKAESNGIYDFRTPIKSNPADSAALKAAKLKEKLRSYKFHPGMVEGVYNVRNIKEDITLAPFTANWLKKTGVYIDDLGHPQPVGGAGKQLEVKLVPVYFDADVQIDDVIQGGTAVPGTTMARVQSQRMLGYLQLRPRGVFIDAEDFAGLLTLMQGLGGPVDCMVNVNHSNQKMRVSRIEVNPGTNELSQRVFITAAKGTPVLPQDGSWSVVQHNAVNKEVTPLSKNEVIPLIRKGIRTFTPGSLSFSQDKTTHAVNIAEASELFNDLENRVKQFGFLQSTGENKVLFRNPLFVQGVDLLKGSVPDLADAYRLMNSKGIFPKVENLPKLDQVGEMASQFGMKIIDEGYKLLNNTLADAEKKLEQLLPEGPWYIVKTNDVKVYIDYKPTNTDGTTKPGGKATLDFDIDSKARNWINKMNDVTMVVDLGPFTRLLLIRGKFDTQKGSSPAFIKPELEFGPDLKPVVDILVLLSEIAVNPNYTDILKQGLKIAMSNNPNNWEYKFQADKEIPLIKFPPPLLDTAAAPLRLEAGLKAGIYFNVAIPLPPGGGLPAPSAGAFVEFYGKLSVMCVSVGVGTIYAVGQVTVRISADTVTGPALYMKFGFGVEAVVALPVVGSVSVYFAVGVEMSLDSTQITIAGFVLFKGRAEILGGIVTVTIQIEASGKVQKRLGSGPTASTTMIAQVTFSLDISICFIINISFSESWQEEKQIA